MASMRTSWRPESRWRVGVALLMSVPFALFWMHLDGQFVWDDEPYVARCQLLRAPEGWWKLFVSELVEIAEGRRQDRYHPIPMLTLWLQFKVSTSIVWLRLGNVALHAANAGLLASIARRLGIGSRVALFAALAFAVHPLATELVMLITARHYTVAILFVLLALVVGPLHSKGWSMARLAVATAFVFFACISIESAVVAPAVLACATLLRPPTDGERPVTAQRLPKAVTIVVPFVGVALMFLVRRSLAIASTNSAVHAPLLSHVKNLGTLVFRYAHDIVLFTQGGSVALYRPLALSSAAIVLIATFAIVALLLVVRVRAWRAQQSSPYADRALLGLAWFLLALSPFMIAVPISGVWANRYGYFASMGLLIAIATGFERATLRRSRWLQVAVAAPVALLLGVAALNTSVRARQWHDPISLFSIDLEENPNNPWALLSIAPALLKEQGCPRTVELLLRTVKASPNQKTTLRNTIICLESLGRIAEAEVLATHEAVLVPEDPRVFAQLAFFRLDLGMDEKAADAVRAGLRRHPSSVDLLELAARLKIQ